LKPCTKCKIVKDNSCFYPRKDVKSGLTSYCKKCETKRSFKYAETKKAWSIKNKEKHLKIMSDWRKNNKAKAASYTRERYALKNKAMPAWANKEKIQQYYDFAAYMKWITLGIEYHVDHIVPLKGKNVCGLHTQDNLQILRADQNRIKHNSFQ
jgi:hypothetical protein